MDTRMLEALPAPTHGAQATPPPPAPAPPSSPSTGGRPVRRGVPVFATVVIAAGAALTGGVAGGLVARDHSVVAAGLVLPAARSQGAASAPTVSGTGSGIDVASIVAATTPSVVRIQSTITGTDIFQQPITETGTGTGFVGSADGLIYTNAHVVGDATTVTVTLADGTTKDGTVVGTDATDDLAVVKVDANGLIPLPIGIAADVRVGDPVVAVGNALALPGGPTATAGIISALNRSIDTNNGEHLARLIQTDAAINPGNSGGPLLNAAGEVVGINTAGANNAENVGFAISLDTALPILQELSTGQPHLKAFLGVQTVSIDAGLAQRLGVAVGGGVYVEGVTAESAAEVAGIKAGDVIVSIDGTAVAAPGDIATVMSEHQPDDTVTVTVFRNGSSTDLSVVLGSHTA